MARKKKLTPPPSPSKWQNLPLYALGFLLVGMILLGAGAEIWNGIKRSQPEPIAESSTAEDDRKTVKLTLEQRLNAALTMRRLPPPPAPDPRTKSTAIPTIPAGLTGDQVLLILVEAHPHPLINTSLDDAIRSHEMGIANHVEEKATATFGVRRLDQIKRTSHRPKSDVVPVLGIPLEKLRTATSESKIIFWWVSIYHEAVHWQQWLRAESEEEREIFAPTGNEDFSPTRLQCEINFRNELEAYNRACELVREWQWHDMYRSKACLYEEGADRDYAIFVDAMYPRWTHFPTCLPVWAEMAGHPHPELFEL